MHMDEAIKGRHSVRDYKEEEIAFEVVEALEKMIKKGNDESGLHMTLCRNEPTAFQGFLAHYGRFSNVHNYILIKGKKGKAWQETAGYFGERLVLYAYQLGLQSCWVTQTFRKRIVKKQVDEDEKLICIIALGYGKTMGKPHLEKSWKDLCSCEGNIPLWFQKGMEAVQLAPSAFHQQKFRFYLQDNNVSVSPGTGFYTWIDMGIAKYHFEQGASSDAWQWKK